ncbi:hypothetical protein B6N58_11725 [Legionella micdadei]|nr:hypothetical protein B6N58_11725 [Legionella micdadei]
MSYSLVFGMYLLKHQYKFQSISFYLQYFNTLNSPDHSFEFYILINKNRSNANKCIIMPLREIVVFEYDIVRHGTPFVGKTRGKIYNKIKWLKLLNMTHNPLVLGSSPSGPTNKIK